MRARTAFIRIKSSVPTLDGSNIEDLVTFKGGSGSPSFIAIGIATPVNSTTVKEDVNRDGVVDVQDLAVVGLRYGKTGTNAADVNGDGVVNVDDFILVAAAVDSCGSRRALLLAQKWNRISQKDNCKAGLRRHAHQAIPLAPTSEVLLL